MKHFINFITLLIFTQLLSQEKVTIYSYVIDSSNKRPISDANVYIKGTSIGTITNDDGAFMLNVSSENIESILVISCLGYKSLSVNINTINHKDKLYIEPFAEELDEVFINSKSSLTGNEIIKKVFDNYQDNFPKDPYLLKGFLRHSEKNKKEYRWFIESAITVYDNSAQNENAEIKINVDQKRKSYDNRKIDSLFLYYLYRKDNYNKNVSFKKIAKRKNIEKIPNNEFLKGINYNDNLYNGLFKVFNGHKNIIHNKKNFNNGNQHIIRNYGNKNSMFDKNIFKKHSFKLDTILYENERLVYKVKITPHPKMINLNEVIKKNYAPIGWVYVYKDNFAIKEIQYSLIAKSKDAQIRNDLLYGSPIHYSIKIKFKEFEGKMYMQYFSCSTPKLLNIGLENYTKTKETSKIDSSDNFYFSKQEIFFNEIITNGVIVQTRYKESWNDDLFENNFSCDSLFWDNYNYALESEEEKKMIEDLEKKVSLKEQFKNK